MKFLKNIAMAALVTTALAGNVMGAVKVELEDLGVDGSKLSFTSAMFEAAVNKAAFASGGSDLAEAIVSRATDKAVSDIKALGVDGAKSDGEIIGLVGTKLTAPLEENLTFNAILDLADADENEVQSAVDTLAEKIIASLKLKDKDQAMIESMSADLANFQGYKTLKVKKLDGTIVTLEELAKNPADAKKATLSIHGSDVALCDVLTSHTVSDLKKLAAYQVLVDSEAHHKNEALRHKTDVERLTKELEDEVNKPKVNAEHKLSHDALTDLDALVLKGFSKVIKYEPGKPAENIRAVIKLNAKLSGEVTRLTRQLADALKKTPASVATTSDSGTTTLPKGSPKSRSGSADSSVSSEKGKVPSFASKEGKKLTISEYMEEHGFSDVRDARAHAEENSVDLAD